MVILAETPAASFTDTSITPGVAGFLVTFALALCCWVLFRSMTRHVRKVKHNALMAGSSATAQPRDETAPGPGPAGAVQAHDAGASMTDTSDKPSSA